MSYRIHRDASGRPVGTVCLQCGLPLEAVTEKALTAVTRNHETWHQLQARETTR